MCQCCSKYKLGISHMIWQGTTLKYIIFSNTDGSPSLAKSSQLPALMEAQKRKLDEDKHQLERLHTAREKQFQTYYLVRICCLERKIFFKVTGTYQTVSPSISRIAVYCLHAEKKILFNPNFQRRKISRHSNLHIHVLYINCMWHS